MILQNPPQIHRFPADNLTDLERLNRLFSGADGKWRLLAVLRDGSGAGRLLLPELRSVVEKYCLAGLLSRIVFLGESKLEKLEQKIRSWNCPNTRVSGLDIHASRIAGENPLPLVRLYDPEGKEVWSVSGFDTDCGLDDLAANLGTIFGPGRD